MFLSKALLMGFTGGLAGYTLGVLVGLGRQADTTLSFLDPPLFLLACCTAMFLSVVARWAPAYYAAQQDPAEVLREE
jgi:ABC-type lipoprotein release transport system permease subunit